jgi:FkbM family methyltransferase
MSGGPEGQGERSEAVECRLPGSRGALSIRGEADDESIIGSLRMTGTYAPHLLRFLGSIVGTKWTSLDVGANVGIVALFLGRSSPDGVVHAFEPVGETYRYLLENISANAARNVSAHQVAISDHRGEMVMHYTKRFAAGAFSATTNVNEATTAHPAPTWPLDEWLLAHDVERVDFIKMDIEGGELAAIDGARELLSRMGPDLLVELNPVVLHRFQNRSWEDLIDAIATLYPHLFYVREDGEIVEPLNRRHWERVLARHGLVDLYATRHPERAVSAGVANPALGGRLRSAADYLLGLVRVNHLLVPTRCFVVAPRYEMTTGVSHLRGRRGDRIVVPVRLRNRSRFWLSSSMRVSPVYASYRWLDWERRRVIADGTPTPLARNVRPGRSLSVDLDVTLPALPGRYRLLPTLCQLEYGWLDELMPEPGPATPVVVE